MCATWNVFLTEAGQSLTSDLPSPPADLSFTSFFDDKSFFGSHYHQCINKVQVLSEFSDCLKIANFIPIFKESSKKSICWMNRSLSILGVISQIVEKSDYGWKSSFKFGSKWCFNLFPNGSRISKDTTIPTIYWKLSTKAWLKQYSANQLSQL